MRKKDFPIFSGFIDNKPLVYLDSAATTHKPRIMIERMQEFYAHEYATTNRSMYFLAEKATASIERARHMTATFINAEQTEIIFTKGATEGINFIASAWGWANLQEGDEIILSELEHHANLLPWQHLALQKKCIIKYIPVRADGTLNYEVFETLFTPRTKLVSIVHISNALGTLNDIARIVARAKEYNCVVMLDACQSAGYIPLDVQQLNVDFLVFSTHKMLGPSGLGILYINKRIQPHVPPYQFGGGMVYEADYHTATWLSSPACYEAGTLPLASIISFGATLEYYKTIEWNALHEHTTSLIGSFIQQVQALPRIKLLGPLHQMDHYAHLITFMVDGYHAHDVGAWLDKSGIAVRTGHYCAQPLAKRLGITSSIRLSVHIYNTIDDINECVAQLKKLL